MPKLDLHVLVVDDELDARELLGLMLERSVRRVHLASSAAEAFEHVAVRGPDVIVSDICMPVEDGWSLMRRIRSLPLDRGGGIHAIAATALGGRNLLERARAAGFDCLLTKPVEEGALLAAVLASRVGRQALGERSSSFVMRMRRLSAEARAISTRLRKNGMGMSVVFDRDVVMSRRAR